MRAKFYLFIHACVDDVQFTFPDRIFQKAETSRESEAFQHAYSDFFTHISDHDPHLTIVNLLYSSGMLDKATRDAVTDARKQRVNQIRCLLAELETQIEARPDTYQELVSALKHGEKCCFSDLAMLLQQKYGKAVGIIVIAPCALWSLCNVLPW